MPHIDAPSGITWFYETEGKGKPLVFLHGWAVDRRIWRQQYKHFSNTFSVMSIDLPGHGNSSFKSVGLDEMTQEISELIRQNTDQPVTVLASSLGGLFALNMYKQDSELFEKMVLVGSLPKFTESDDYAYGISQSRMAKLTDQMRKEYPSIINVFFRSLFTPHERRSRRFKWLNKFRQADTHPLQDSLMLFLNILDQTDLREVYKDIKCPLLMVNGGGDQISDQRTVDYLKRLRPDVTYLDYPELGHFPFLSEPYRFNNDVQPFLEEKLKCLG